MEDSTIVKTKRYYKNNFKMEVQTLCCII